MTIPEGFAEITYKFTGAAAPRGAYVVFGVQNVADVGAPTVANLARASFTSSTMPARLTDDVALTEVRAKLGPDATGDFASETGSWPGTQATTSFPPQVATLVRKVTGSGGRRGRGRMYFPGVPETGVDDAGIISAAGVTAWNLALADFLGALSGNDLPMYLLHDPATIWTLVNGQPRRVPISGPIPAPDVVSSLIVDPKVATQRRRLRA